jgi:uncharacterized damage-inducible protein DinB
MNAHQHFATLARYNHWATRRLLEAIEPLSDEDYRRDVGLFFKSIHGTLNHLLVGEHMLWYRRFAEDISPKLALDEEIEPVRERLAQALKGGAANWLPLIESWPVEKFDGKLSYVTTKGIPVNLPFAATLAHVLGRPCPELDLVYMLQEESKA